jgi:hypothetical protein
MIGDIIRYDSARAQDARSRGLPSKPWAPMRWFGEKAFLWWLANACWTRVASSTSLCSLPPDNCSKCGHVISTTFTPQCKGELLKLHRAIKRKFLVRA